MQTVGGRPRGGGGGGEGVARVSLPGADGLLGRTRGVGGATPAQRLRVVGVTGVHERGGLVRPRLSGRRPWGLAGAGGGVAPGLAAAGWWSSARGSGGSVLAAWRLRAGGVTGRASAAGERCAVWRPPPGGTGGAGGYVWGWRGQVGEGSATLGHQKPGKRGGLVSQSLLLPPTGVGWGRRAAPSSAHRPCPLARPLLSAGAGRRPPADRRPLPTSGPGRRHRHSQATPHHSHSATARNHEARARAPHHPLRPCARLPPTSCRHRAGARPPVPLVRTDHPHHPQPLSRCRAPPPSCAPATPTTRRR